MPPRPEAALDGFTPIRGKCFYWREKLLDDDRFDPSVKKEDWRVECTCFVEGNMWRYTMDTVPSNCPLHRHCRYYIQTG
ncbi:MAG: hypothetical protein ISP10_02910 [Aeromicrobium sp.]|jgi:hypothetical protein|nr:hypothetical protein [Aeromicrobium sp.]